LPHCCTRDRSLIGLQAELLGYAGSGIRNMLFITGDPPKLGDYPFSTGVFDTDAIGLVKLQDRMNRGFDLGGNPLNAPTMVTIGVGADPNAIDPDREYRRLVEKVESGADFIVTQPVFDAKSLFAFIDRIAHLNVPVIAGIWPLASTRNAEFMRNEVPGVSVPDEVMQMMYQAGDDKTAQRDTGIAIARKLAQEVRSRVQGIQVSAPFGNVELALRVIEK
jgi:homocysteine S-methyltransferase